MRRNGVRSLVLLSVLIVFSLLLVGGGPRLIGHADGDETGVIAAAVPLRAALSQVPQGHEETVLHRQSAPQPQRREIVSDQHDMHMPERVISDANGNVLRCVSYLRAVYQSFSLGDGFV